MFKPYYECHVTFMSQPTLLSEIARELKKWKTSAIDGDPLLGDGVKCYLTRHYSGDESREILHADMDHAAQRLKSRSLEVLRHKIELVVWDSRAAVS